MNERFENAVEIRKDQQTPEEMNITSSLQTLTGVNTRIAIEHFCVDDKNGQEVLIRFRNRRGLIAVIPIAAHFILAKEFHREIQFKQNAILALRSASITTNRLYDILTYGKKAFLKELYPTTIPMSDEDELYRRCRREAGKPVDGEVS